MKKLTLLSVVALGTIALVGVAKVDGDTTTTDGIIKMQPGGNADVLPKDPGTDVDTDIDP